MLSLSYKSTTILITVRLSSLRISLSTSTVAPWWPRKAVSTKEDQRLKTEDESLWLPWHIDWSS